MKGRLAPSGVLGSHRSGPVYGATDSLFVVRPSTIGKVEISPLFLPCQVSTLSLKAADNVAGYSLMVVDDVAGCVAVIGSYQRCTTSSMPAVSTIILSGASARCAAGAPPPEV